MGTRMYLTFDTKAEAEARAAKFPPHGAERYTEPVPLADGRWALPIDEREPCDGAVESVELLDGGP